VERLPAHLDSFSSPESETIVCDVLGALDDDSNTDDQIANAVIFVQIAPSLKRDSEFGSSILTLSLNCFCQDLRQVVLPPIHGERLFRANQRKFLGITEIASGEDHGRRGDGAAQPGMQEKGPAGVIRYRSGDGHRQRLLSLQSDRPEKHQRGHRPRCSLR
jgi:hypothetical protein